MHTLRLTQHSVGENQYKVEIALEGGQFRHSAVSEFEFSLSPQDQESIRWYLEDYPLYRHDPAPKIADRVEKRMAEIGRELFRHVFQASDDAREIWADLRREVNAARVEVVADVREATAIPWELLRDPKTDTCLALHAAAFVHSNFQPARPFRAMENGEGPIRILLTICRPGGRNDVPFRSVASQLIKGLADADRDLFQLDVLRPATYDTLGKTLRKASGAGKPYHVVHFDGHGAFVEMDDVIAAMKQKDEEREKAVRRLLAEIGIANAHRFDAAATVYPKGQRAGKHGYLCFENPDHPENLRFVDGDDIGNLLAEAGVPVLVLNACRSAHAEAPEKPEENPDAVGTGPHAQTRAFGSLAQEIVNAGTAGVVAMRYNVYVVTAAQFVADLYGSLIAGNPLGKAVTLGRKSLSANPIREITGDALALQDWCVPVVYEAGPIALFPEGAAEKSLKITLSDSRATPSRGHLDPELPPTPDAGFWGRDETLLALDRAFDDHGLVLLHAYAGSGKTAAVAEFARWYALTGGVEGPVLFTSFEQYKPLARVLDKFGQVFGQMLEQQAGVNWLAKSDDERRDIALQVMGQVPVLWIWDNVEPVAGFPTGAESAWSADEQKELADFLRAARGTKAKFLLTSRRNEKPWLGDLPVRITLPAMPMHEREQMARGLAATHNRKLRDLKAWRPLLRFTGGNPLTLTVLVGQALRDGLTNEAQVAGFVEKLSRGETAFEDEETDGRTRSLAASLNYGFENAFSEDERKILALLYFFQGFVNVQVLQAMGNPKLDSALPILRDQTRETLIPILDRAAEVGLLTALGSGCYTIHPALPWFFKEMFYRYYPTGFSSETKQHVASGQAQRAFVEAVGQLGNFYHRLYGQGDSSVIVALSKEEANLLYSLRLARKMGAWDSIITTVQGLRKLYQHMGRRREWRRIVEKISPNFINPVTKGPIAGREDQWRIVAEYSIRILMEEYQFAEANKLIVPLLEWYTKMANPYLKMTASELTSEAQDKITSLAICLNDYGLIQLGLRGDADVENFMQPFNLFYKIGNLNAASECAINIGNAYKDTPKVVNFDEAEKWYAQSINLRNENDNLGRGKGFMQLGNLAFEKYKKAEKYLQDRVDSFRYLKDALTYFHKAIDTLPKKEVGNLSIVHQGLGTIYFLLGKSESATYHNNRALELTELQGDNYRSGCVRSNMAVILAQSNRTTDAAEYANAALQDFKKYGDQAADIIEETKVLIQQLSEPG